jgi:hypothetical protein
VARVSNQQSAVPVSSGRLFRRVLIASALVLALLLAGCSRQQDPDKYTGSVQKNFLLACQGKNPDQKQKFTLSSAECTCTYDKILKQIPFSRFKKVNDDLRHQPGPFPSDIANLVESCSGTSGASTTSASSTTSTPR